MQKAMRVDTLPQEDKILDEELIDTLFAISVVKKRLATKLRKIKDEGEFKAGGHCQFCKVKATCRKRAEYNLEMAKYDFEMPDTLEDYEIDAILIKVDELTSWA